MTTPRRVGCGPVTLALTAAMLSINANANAGRGGVRHPDDGGGPAQLPRRRHQHHHRAILYRRCHLAARDDEPIGTNRTATLTHPNITGFVSLRATATDFAGNSVNQTTIRAYKMMS